MNYDDYDEYARKMFGFQINNQYSDNLERMYPEVYRVVYPMVCYACDNITMPVTEAMVNIVVNDIYDRVEADGRINIEVVFEADFKTTRIDNDEEMEYNKKMPRRRNRFLRDLIRILLLRELLHRRPKFPIRPY